MKTRRIIFMVIAVVLAGILAILPEKDNSNPEIGVEQIFHEMNQNTRFFSTDEIADLLINQDPSLQLIDIRSAEEFDKFSLPNSINIPAEKLMEEEYQEYLQTDYVKNVLYGNGTVKADQIWMILRRVGFNNMYVLDGGLNNWVETILRPTLPSITETDNVELDKYMQRKAASMYFGKGEGEKVVEKPRAPKAVVKRKRVETEVAGGC